MELTNWHNFVTHKMRLILCLAYCVFSTVNLVVASPISSLEEFKEFYRSSSIHKVKGYMKEAEDGKTPQYATGFNPLWR